MKNRITMEEFIKQEIGFIQIRILKENQMRVINSTSMNKFLFDLVSLVANPNSSSVQPLTFSPIYSYKGVMVLPALAENPLAATMVLAAILAAEAIDWDSFFRLFDILRDSKYPQVKKEIENGMRALQEAHDELEKPLKEAGIINGKTRNSSTDEKNNTRQYDKTGGEKELQKDFDKLPGEVQIAADGTQYKTLPNGNRAVKRPASDKQAPTLEVQPPQNGSEAYEKLRIKVRYL